MTYPVETVAKTDGVVEDEIDNYDLKSIEIDKAYAKAAENGWAVVLPKSNELLLDIDNEADMAVFERLRIPFNRFIRKMAEVKVTPSKSGMPGKCHITVTLDQNVTADERIMYQAILGSDRMREILSLARWEHDLTSPTIFFEKP